MSKKIIQLNTEVTSDFDSNEGYFLADLAFALVVIGRKMYSQEQAETAKKVEADLWPLLFLLIT